jgi:hypothetical protein
MSINPDFSDMLAALSAEGAEFLLIGGYAVMRYTEPRYTKDLDLWVRPSPDNAARVFRALVSYGAPLTGISPADFAEPGAIYQIGVAPNRIDLVTSIDGVEFDEAWATRTHAVFDDLEVALPSPEVLLRNKRASGRPRDLVDAAALERVIARR